MSNTHTHTIKRENKRPKKGGGLLCVPQYVQSPKIGPTNEEGKENVEEGGGGRGGNYCVQQAARAVTENQALQNEDASTTANWSSGREEDGGSINGIRAAFYCLPCTNTLEGKLESAHTTRTSLTYSNKRSPNLKGEALPPGGTRTVQRNPKTRASHCCTPRKLVAKQTIFA